MPDLAAYRASLQHRHDWRQLPGEERVIDWCPGCGALRPHTDSDIDDVPTA